VINSTIGGGMARQSFVLFAASGLCFLYPLLLINNYLDYRLLSLLFTLGAFVLVFIVASANNWVRPVLFLVLTAFMMHGFFITSHYAFNGPEHYLWAVDTYNQHLKKALTFKDFLSGNSPLVILDSDNFYNRNYISAMVVGFFFFLGDTNPFFSSLAMIVVKCFTIILIFNTVRNITRSQQIAVISSFLYIINPDVFYYTLIFYKEFFVHFLVALFFYFISCVKPKYLMAFIPIALMYIDRFYLSVFLFVSLIVIFIAKEKPSIGVFLTIFISSFVLGMLVIKSITGNYNIYSFFDRFLSHKLHYSLNSNAKVSMGFFLDFIRISFTPFINIFTVEKFSNYSSLLIAGGVFHKAVMMMYFYGLSRFHRSPIVWINLTVLALLILFALIGPFNGRVRDSIYPIIVMWAGIGLNTFLIEIKKISCWEHEKD